MSITTENPHDSGLGGASWEAGVVGGLVGSAVMAGLMFVMNEAVLGVAVPSLYTLAPPQNPGVGLVVHLFHGTVLGVVFAGIVGGLQSDPTEPLGRSRTIGLGIAWGVATWVVLAALLMPVWLSTVGSPANPPVPNFALPSLLWHVVYGVSLGAVYVALEDTL